VVKMNFNHWFFTCSSFGSEKKKLAVPSNCRPQGLLDMMLSSIHRNQLLVWGSSFPWCLRVQ